MWQKYVLVIHNMPRYIQWCLHKYTHIEISSLGDDEEQLMIYADEAKSDADELKDEQIKGP